MKVAVLGTGTMGSGMARSLLRDGHDVTVWNRTPGRAAALASDGAIVADSASGAVRGADVVITMVFDLDAVVTVAREFVPALKPDAVWLQSATVGPEGIRSIAELAAASGAQLVDAPVVGTKRPAEEGKLVVLVAGPQPLIDRAQPVLESIGSKTVVAGATLGQASSLKLACNAWVATITAGIAQSLAMCVTLGVEPALFLQAIDGGPSDTPYAHIKGALMLAADYEPQFAVDALAKDLRLMIDVLGPGFGTLLPALSHVFESASDSGRGGQDVAAIYGEFGK